MVDDLLQAAKDADAYRTAVEAFVANVDTASKAVEDGREKLEKAKRERAERQSLYNLISEWKGQSADALGSLTDTEIVSDPSQVLRVYLKAKASCRRPPKIYNVKKCKK